VDNQVGERLEKVGVVPARALFGLVGALESMRHASRIGLPAMLLRGLGGELVSGLRLVQSDPPCVGENARRG
jgi:hypothetical protein